MDCPPLYQAALFGGFHVNAGPPHDEARGMRLLEGFGNLNLRTGIKSTMMLARRKRSRAAYAYPAINHREGKRDVSRQSRRAYRADR
jgi:hypothetical protein